MYKSAYAPILADETVRRNARALVSPEGDDLTRWSLKIPWARERILKSAARYIADHHSFPGKTRSWGDGPRFLTEDFRVVSVIDVTRGGRLPADRWGNVLVVTMQYSPLGWCCTVAGFLDLATGRWVWTCYAD